MKIGDLWRIDYGKLSEIRYKALVKLSRVDCPEQEKPVLRRICEIWKQRSDWEIN